MLAAVSKIAQSVDVPVTADLEGGNDDIAEIAVAPIDEQDCMKAGVWKTQVLLRSYGSSGKEEIAICSLNSSTPFTSKSRDCAASGVGHSAVLRVSCFYTGQRLRVATLITARF
jgi:hypothetical protein